MGSAKQEIHIEKVVKRFGREEYAVHHVIEGVEFSEREPVSQRFRRKSLIGYLSGVGIFPFHTEVDNEIPQDIKESRFKGFKLEPASKEVLNELMMRAGYYEYSDYGWNEDRKKIVAHFGLRYQGRSLSWVV